MVVRRRISGRGRRQTHVPEDEYKGEASPGADDGAAELPAERDPEPGHELPDDDGEDGRGEDGGEIPDTKDKR